MTTLSNLHPRYDLIVIGGGITGAGLLREASRTGASILLLEQNDFASGTSSASSKLVHGGLRYLKTGQWQLTLESVRERQRLLEEAGGLVETQPFLLPLYRGAKPGKLAIRVGLWIYDRMAGESSSRWLDAQTALGLEPQLRRENLRGAMHYEDARTDDARLVLRLIFESLSERVHARNYTGVSQLLHGDGRVSGVVARDTDTGATREIEAGLVVDATGAHAGRLQAEAVGVPKLRPLRGSHFVFPPAAFPISRAVSWLHPRDRRPIFAYPWEGAVLYGTTDVDHGANDPLRMSAAEAEYLLEALAWQFPELRLDASHAVSTYAGVRPVVASGKDKPSDESRESAMWSVPGLAGITGGKLTTFRVTAREVLREAAKQLPALAPAPSQPVFLSAHPVESQRRLYGRLGISAGEYLNDMPGEEQKQFADLPYAPAEMRWAAQREHVRHLDDLLLRRTRIGLVAPAGGQGLLPQVRAACQRELNWDDARWQSEERRYLDLWQKQHSPVSPT